MNIGVVCGGNSVEHEVSLISALQMINHINRDKYNPIIIYLSKDNEFYYNEKMDDIDFFKDLDYVINNSKKIIIQKKSNTHELLEIKNNRLKKVTDLDVIFLVVHGTNCEDGTLSAYFELLDIPYVGSNVLASAINQNKWKMKEILKFNQIPIIDYVGIYEVDYYQKEKEFVDRCEELTYPLIVKPATLGSSVGITKCMDKEQLHQGILTALMYDDEVIVEKALKNFMELNCSVLGDRSSLKASPIERVIQEDEILSYKDKYLRGGKASSKGIVNTKRQLPAEIDEQLAHEITHLAIDTIKIVGGSGVSRIDFLYDMDEKQIYVNEINTIPGSLAFYLWKADNMEYQELIECLIKIALREYRIKHSKISSYESNILQLPRNFNKGKLR